MESVWAFHPWSFPDTRVSSQLPTAHMLVNSSPFSFTKANADNTHGIPQLKNKMKSGRTILHWFVCRYEKSSTFLWWIPIGTGGLQKHSQISLNYVLSLIPAVMLIQYDHMNQMHVDCQMQTEEPDCHPSLLYGSIAGNVGRSFRNDPQNGLSKFYTRWLKRLWFCDNGICTCWFCCATVHVVIRYLNAYEWRKAKDRILKENDGMPIDMKIAVGGISASEMINVYWLIERLLFKKESMLHMGNIRDPVVLVTSFCRVHCDDQIGQ